MAKPIVLIAGGTGMIGLRLQKILEREGYTVRILSRQPAGTPGAYFWNPETGETDLEALREVDIVINLAGAGIADKRWTDVRKKVLVDSRVNSAETLRKAFAAIQRQPATYLQASAVGIYGNSGETEMFETSAPADQGFMVDCCTQWEAAAQGIGLRNVVFRIGVVLSLEGGALPELIKPMYFGIAPWFGNGKAWWPWIHIDDVCGAFHWAIEQQQVAGVFNLVAPAPARNRALVEALVAQRFKWTIKVPAPAFALQLMLGEMSAVVLNSNRVSAQKLLEAGYPFRFSDLNSALRDIFAAQTT